MKPVKTPCIYSQLKIKIRKQRIFGQEEEERQEEYLPMRQTKMEIKISFIGERRNQQDTNF